MKNGADNGVERLKRVLPPPPSPPLRWDLFGIGFPSDYKAFVYGAGSIDGELMVVAPTPTRSQPDGFADYLEFATGIGAAFTSMCNADPPESPYQGYPAPNGLLVWAVTLNGDRLMWHTDSPDPDTWTVLAWLRDAAEPWQQPRGSASTYSSKSWTAPSSCSRTSHSPPGNPTRPEDHTGF